MTFFKVMLSKTSTDFGHTKNEVLMGTLNAVTSWKYSASSRYLKIFYDNGSGDLYYPVPPFIYDNLLRCHDKTAFVHKYLEYDLHFSRVSID